jgi:hypothetical protein
MPNGDPFASPSEWKRITAFFQRLSPILSTFASTHNLAIDEYYHESPSWAFRFQHPKGGAASIHVERIDDSIIRVGRSWYIDEFENFSRFLKSDEGSELALDGIDLREILKAKLQDIVTWEQSDMIAHSDYEKYWSRYTREEWDQMSQVQRLPQPKL